MGMVGDLLKGKTLVGLAVGLGAAVLAPRLLPVLAQAAKPVAKAAIKSGLVLFEKGKELAAETGEIVEDLWAEAKAEVEEEHALAAGMAGTGAACPQEQPEPEAGRLAVDEADSGQPA
ncbi:MAG: DUF5132 domain-containing protein [Thermodesulfobacteriota bacterium]